MNAPKELPTTCLNAPLYKIDLSYAENVEKGPFFSEKMPHREFPPQEQWIDFLGHPVASPLGVPAGPLLTSRWIEHAAHLGFDILTYKTIRSQSYPAHPLPNMIFVDAQGIVLPEVPSSMEELGVTNSFGMPSQNPEFLMHDISKANQLLKKGQVLVVSVVGTPNLKERSFFEDFLYTAAFAKEAGAKIIEANFSCPNVGGEGCLYLNSSQAIELAQQLVKVISPLPLILKVGLFPSDEQMRSFLIGASRVGVRAISGINTLKMKVVGKDGKPALGENRPSSGVCGSPIRLPALRFVSKARQVIDEESLELTLIGVGGITLPSHFDDMFEAGADVAMTATGMMWDPYLGLRYAEHALQGKVL
jgi:dihydroorotate dehydrogenase (NAD+) catalytic subunit